LRLIDRTDPETELVGRKIIELAQKGERDQATLAIALLVRLEAKHIINCDRSEGNAMPIVTLLQQEAFDHETTGILTTAFDKAWDKFKSSGNALADDTCAPSTRALLAKRIIETAQKGERSIDRLVENGITYLEGVK
jgi:hypothetical protein